MCGHPLHLPPICKMRSIFTRRIKFQIRFITSPGCQFSTKAPYIIISPTDIGVDARVDGGLRILTINRPKQKNAFTINGYLKLQENLFEANEDDNTKIVVLVGKGDIFSSGNDPRNFLTPAGIKSFSFYLDLKLKFSTLVSSLIDLKKPLIVLVNGPAVGIAVAMLGHADAVFASDKATFITPFSILGLSPECCSSYLFPKIMGYARAENLIVFNKKITAERALEWGLLTDVYPDAEFNEKAWEQIRNFEKLPMKAMSCTKVLTRETERAILHDVNRRECNRLAERLLSEESRQAVHDFVNKVRTIKKERK